MEGFIGDPSHGSKSKIDAFLASLRGCTRNKDLVTGNDPAVL